MYIYNILIVVADCCFNPIQQHHHETSPDFVPGCLSGHLRGGLGLGPRSLESFIEIWMASICVINVGELVM